MKVLETVIKDITMNDKYLEILCTEKQIKINMIDGTVDITIKTDEDKEVGYTYLQKNDLIKILYKNEENNYIIPKKIYINTKYDFNSESSDSETI